MEDNSIKKTARRDSAGTWSPDLSFSRRLLWPLSYRCRCTSFVKLSSCCSMQPNPPRHVVHSNQSRWLASQKHHQQVTAVTGRTSTNRRYIVIGRLAYFDFSYSYVYPHVRLPGPRKLTSSSMKSSLSALYALLGPCGTSVISGHSEIINEALLLYITTVISKLCFLHTACKVRTVRPASEKQPTSSKESLRSHIGHPRLRLGRQLYPIWDILYFYSLGA